MSRPRPTGTCYPLRRFRGREEDFNNLAEVEIKRQVPSRRPIRKETFCAWNRIAAARKHHAHPGVQPFVGQEVIASQRR
jgi:hypothetical protein